MGAEGGIGRGILSSEECCGCAVAVGLDISDTVSPDIELS